MDKYASGEKPMVGDVVRCGIETLEVTSVAFDCVKCGEAEGVRWFMPSRYELVRRAGKFVPRLGWWRQRDGGLALTDYRDEESELISGVANYNNDKPYMESWELDGKRQSDEKSQVDLTEFLGPLEVPDFPEPDIIDGPGAYENEDGEEYLVIASSGGDWLVYIPSEGDTLHRYYHNGGHIGGAMYRIVKKLRDGIEL